MSGELPSESANPLQDHRFGRFVLQCEGIVAQKNSILSTYDDLPSYEQVCKTITAQTATGIEVNTEKLSEMKSNLLDALNAAQDTLTVLDTQISNASGANKGHMQGSHNSGIEEIKKRIKRMEDQLRRESLNDFASSFSEGAYCMDWMNEFTNLRENRHYRLTEMLAWQNVELPDGSRSTDIAQDKLRAVHQIVRTNSAPLQSLANQTNEFHSGLSSMRTQAQQIRTQQFQAKIPALKVVVEHALEANGLTASARNKDDRSPAVIPLQNFIDTQIARRGGEEFWTPKDFRSQMEPLIQKLQTEATRYRDSSVLQEYLRESRRETTPTGPTEVDAGRGQARRSLFEKFWNRKT